jgi:hypothetical protein
MPERPPLHVTSSARRAAAPGSRLRRAQSGQVSTYDLPVQEGTTGLDIDFHTADASPDNKYTFFLIDPSGAVAATDTTPKTVDGQSVATAELGATDPAPGTWEIDVMLNLTVSGKEFTQTVCGLAHVTR